jgi:hypothetical protein
MKKKIAEEICGMSDEILGQMQILNNYVNTNCEQSERERIVRALGLCLTEIDLEILEPIYRKYPEFKPAFLP